MTRVFKVQYSGYETRHMVLEQCALLLGLKEIPGKQHEPEILAFASEVGHPWVDNDELAWCASAAGAVLKRSGMFYFKTLRSRDYLNYPGATITYDMDTGEGILPGHICVFSRGTNPAYGHIGFAGSVRNKNVHLFGGNQSNEFRVSPYSLARLLGVYEPITQALYDMRKRLHPELYK